MLQSGDTLIVAGKGHEEGQTVGTVTLPFSDHAEVRKALEELEAVELALDHRRYDRRHGRASRRQRCPQGITGISIDSRSIAAGRGLLRHQGRPRRRP